MYDLAKDYYIYFNFLDKYIRPYKCKPNKINNGIDSWWHIRLLYYHLKNSLKIKTRYPCVLWYFRVRCGKKKLNKIIKEIIFLGYSDSVWIQEVKS